MEIVTENPTSLAWLGDAIFSLEVRKHLLEKGYQSPKKLQKMNAVFCSAKGQAAIYNQLDKEDWFSEDEREILKRGRNANVHSTAKNADKATYMLSTAFEALLGYLSLYHHEDRLRQLLERSIQIGDTL